MNPRGILKSHMGGGDELRKEKLAMKKLTTNSNDLWKRKTSQGCANWINHGKHFTHGHKNLKSPLETKLAMVQELVLL